MGIGDLPDGAFLDKTNKQRRVPCVLLLDTSASMSGSPIQELQKAFSVFSNSLLTDDTARLASDISIFTFGGTVEVASDWTDAPNLKTPELRASGSTPLGLALLRAFDALEARSKQYGEGIKSYVPWLFIFTDGQPDLDEDWQRAIERAKVLQGQEGQKAKVIIWAVYTSTGSPAADATRHLQSITPRVFELQNADYAKMFQWLSMSMIVLSNSNPNAKLTVPEPPKQMKLSDLMTINP